MDVFWQSQPATLPPGPSRVAAAVLVRDATQRRLAWASLQRMARINRAPVTTRVLWAKHFWPAAQRLQKFHLQRTHAKLVGDLARRSGGLAQFLASTAAARLNAYVGGFCGKRCVQEAAKTLDLEVSSLQRLLTDSRPGAPAPAGPACKLPPHASPR